MNYRNLGFKAHDYIHLTAIAGIAAGLPLNKIVMSLSLMLGVLNLIIEAEYRKYWENLKVNKTAWLIIGFWFLHIIGLLWTQELDFALNDIRIKLPLLVIPVIILAKPFKSQKGIDIVLHIFLLSLLYTTLYNYLSYNQWIGDRMFNDIRGMSLFGSHIRFGILVSLGAVFCLYYLFTSASKWLFYLPFFIWFSYYTYYSQIISGFLALISGIAALLFVYLFSKHKKLMYVYIVFLLALPISAIVVFINIQPHHQKQLLDRDSLPEKTKEGNEYIHYFIDNKDSKGNYLFIYLSEKEIRREWNKVSLISYDSTDNKGQQLSYTLIRYMTSKGLKKDAEDFKKLDKKDISNIENGIAEFEDSPYGIISRINNLKYEIKHHENPNGHSLLQRLEYWKTAMRIVQSNWFFGVGTGDIQKAFDEQYEKDNSLLTQDNRHRAHNTFLTVLLTFGLFGLIFFYFIWKYTKESLKSENILGFVFIIIAISTFLIEDTLETQTGVTFFAFFASLFLIRINRDNSIA